MDHIFVSYSHNDKSFVDRLIADLKGIGADIWVDRHEPSRNCSACDKTNIRLDPHGLRDQREGRAVHNKYFVSVACRVSMEMLILCVAYTDREALQQLFCLG